MDAANRLNKIASGKGGSAVSASYLYNGLGQRLIKTANVLINAPWRYVYDEAGHLIGEYDKNNAARQETVWLGDMPVAVVKQTAPSTQTIYYVQADHLNTPRVILNSTNTPIWRWDNSDAFGVGQPDEDPDKDTVKFEYNPRFPGQYFDKETNLHYNGFRDYEPRTGRYPAADPIGLAGGDNVYLYANAAPTMDIDPMGLCPWCLGFVLGAAADVAIQVGSGINDGQSFQGALSNVNLTQAAISGAATAVGAGAVSVAADFYKSANLFKVPLEALTAAQRRQAGDLLARAQAAAALALAKKRIGDALPYRPFKKPRSCR